MSVLQRVKQLKDITTNIVTDFNACDINLAAGSNITSLTGRDGKDFASTGYDYKLLYDVFGYKFIRTSELNATFTTSSNIVENNNETFIYCSTISAANYCLGISGDYINLGQSTFAYASYVTGQGIMLFPKPPIGTKQIITGVMDGTTMKVYVGLKLVATFNNPYLSSLTTFKFVFRVQNNTLSSDCDFYSITRIHEALTGDRLVQAIRIKAFENGIKI